MPSSLYTLLIESTVSSHPSHPITPLPLPPFPLYRAPVAIYAHALVLLVSVATQPLSRHQPPLRRRAQEVSGWGVCDPRTVCKSCRHMGLLNALTKCTHLTT